MFATVDIEALASGLSQLARRKGDEETDGQSASSAFEPAAKEEALSACCPCCINGESKLTDSPDAPC
jgi:hypothetical protein